MTWPASRERTRILREVAAAAAADMSGALPWREEWSQYFDGPEGLVVALRARWQRMCEAQLDVHDPVDDLMETYRRLRRSEAGVLRILDGVDDNGWGTTTLPALLSPPVSYSTSPSPRGRRFRFHTGAVLPR